MASTIVNTDAPTIESRVPQWEDDEVSLLDYWLILRRNWRIIVFFPLLVAFISGVWSLFFIPREYQATTRILLPQQLQSAGVGQILALPSAGGGGGALAALTGGGANLGETYKAIVESDWLRTRLVQEFHLDSLLRLENRETQIKAMSKIISTKIDPKSGMISISVTLPGTPQGGLKGSHRSGRWGNNDIIVRRMTAQIANRTLELLQQYLTESNIFQSQKYQKYMEEQTSKALVALRMAQTRLESFQRTSRAIAPSEQATALVTRLSDLSQQKTAAEISAESTGRQINTVVSQLKTQARNVMSLPADSPVVQQWRQKLIDQEAELAVLQKEFTDAHPEVVRQKLEIEETKKQLAKEVNRVLQSADEKLAPRLTDLVVQQISAESQAQALSLAISDLERELSSLPPKMMTYAQLKGDVEVADRRYRMLAEELEKAKMAAAKEPTGFVLLDRAFTPEKKFAPSNTRNVVLAAVVGLMLTIFLAFLSENIHKASFREHTSERTFATAQEQRNAA